MYVKVYQLVRAMGFITLLLNPFNSSFSLSVRVNSTLPAILSVNIAWYLPNNSNARILSEGDLACSASLLRLKKD